MSISADYHAQECFAMVFPKLLIFSCKLLLLVPEPGFEFFVLLYCLLVQGLGLIVGDEVRAVHETRGFGSDALDLFLQRSRNAIAGDIVFFIHLPKHLPETIIFRDHGGCLGHVAGKTLMAIGANVGQHKIGGRFADVVVAVAVDADGVFAVDALREVPKMLALAELFGFIAVAFGTGSDVSAQLGADKMMLRFMSRAVVFDVAPVAIVAGHARPIMDASGEVPERQSQ